ncbi:MAG: hypothetical protein ACREJQ_08750 [bacterium]
MVKTTTARKHLHDLVDRLDEKEAKRIAELLEPIAGTNGAETLTPAEWRKVERGLAEIAAGKVARWEDIRDRYF